MRIQKKKSLNIRKYRDYHKEYKQIKAVVKKSHAFKEAHW